MYVQEFLATMLVVAGIAGEEDGELNHVQRRIQGFLCGFGTRVVPMKGHGGSPIARYSLPRRNCGILYA
jgi:hypothetical protein